MCLQIKTDKNEVATSFGITGRLHKPVIKIGIEIRIEISLRLGLTFQS